MNKFKQNTKKIILVFYLLIFVMTLMPTTLFAANATESEKAEVANQLEEKEFNENKTDNKAVDDKENVTTEENKSEEAKKAIRRLPQSNGVNVVKIGTTEYESLKEALNKSNVGDTIEVIVPELKIDEIIDIPSAKKLTLNLAGNKLILACDKSGKHNITVNKGGSFSIINGKITAEDVNNDGNTCAGISVKDSDFTMDRIEAYGLKSETKGGAIYIYHSEDDKPITVTIKNSNFHDNQAYVSGGAIRITNSTLGGYYGKYYILNNKFIKNKAYDNSGSSGMAFGGAASIETTGEIVIKGNEVSENEAYAKNIYGSWANFNYSCGGGMSLKSHVNAPKKGKFILEDNIFSKNKAQFFGGGIYFELSENVKKDELHLKSGLFSENYAGHAGGGIDYSAHAQPWAIMNNVIITGNKAPAGGGIWACPTARVRNHSTFGAAIIENKLDEFVDPIYGNSGTDVRFEGSDTKIGNIGQNNDPNYHKVSIQDRTFMGNKVNWYSDETNARYQPEDQPLTPDKYTNRSTSFGILGKIVADKDWYEKHKKEAEIIFIGNVAGRRGGAISTNSDIDFGQENLDVEVNIHKKWMNHDGNEIDEGLPQFAEVKLIRKDTNGGTYDLETVKLSKDNNWTYKFENLPSKGYVDGTVLEFSYEVVEVNTPDGFTSEVKNITPTDDAEYEYDIVNTKTDTPKIEIPVNKIWDDSDNKAGKRPDYVIVSLFADGKDTGKTLKLTKENSWVDKFTGLEKEKDGKLISYTVKEKEVKGYKTEVSGNQEDGFNITNTFEPTKPKYPETGDKSNLTLMIVIAVIACVAATYMIRKRTK